MVFTRDPSDTEQLGIKGYNIELHLGGTANVFRFGAIGSGYKGHRTCWNSKGIRHAFQNRFVHTKIAPQPWFRHMGGKGSVYSQSSTFSNPYSLWSF